MNPFEFFIPQNITVGAGTLAKLPECARKLGGSHAMLISGPTLRKMGVVDKAADYLKDAGMAVDIFTDVEANPSVATVEKATEAYKESGADFIVALGGGSPMDVAKAVGVTAKYGGSITEYEGAHKVPGKIVPLIAIPTTAGTGSEVTAFSVITDHSRDYKLTVFSYELLPAYAILDPELLTSAPASVAAACGIDAFSFARLGNVHAMSHPVSAFFNVAHGVANAVLLPVIAEYNALADHGRYLKIYNYISPISAYEDEFEPLMLVDAIRELNEDIGIPEDLTTAIRQAKKGEEISDEEIESKIDAMADDAMKSGNIAVNPRSSRKQDIVKLYYKAL